MQTKKLSEKSLEVRVSIGGLEALNFGEDLEKLFYWFAERDLRN